MTQSRPRRNWLKNKNRQLDFFSRPIYICIACLYTENIDNFCFFLVMYCIINFLFYIKYNNNGYWSLKILGPNEIRKDPIEKGPKQASRLGWGWVGISPPKFHTLSAKFFPLYLCISCCCIIFFNRKVHIHMYCFCQNFWQKVYCCIIFFYGNVHIHCFCQNFWQKVYYCVVFFYREI